ncbi:MAG: FAD-dependent oxidoreductase, partial [Sedimenticolaceae bacterium]
MKTHYELAVIGAGPAGLSAAVTAAAHGVDTVLLDEQSTPGGQIYRNIEAMPVRRAEHLGDEYQRGAELVQRMRAS